MPGTDLIEANSLEEVLLHEQEKSAAPPAQAHLLAGVIKLFFLKLIRCVSRDYVSGRSFHATQPSKIRVNSEYWKKTKQTVTDDRIRWVVNNFISYRHMVQIASIL